jgi:hypothetical protein
MSTNGTRKEDPEIIRLPPLSNPTIAPQPRNPSFPTSSIPASSTGASQGSPALPQYAIILIALGSILILAMLACWCLYKGGRGTKRKDNPQPEAQVEAPRAYAARPLFESYEVSKSNTGPQVHSLYQAPIMTSYTETNPGYDMNAYAVETFQNTSTNGADSQLPTVAGSAG